MYTSSVEKDPMVEMFRLRSRYIDIVGIDKYRIQSYIHPLSSLIVYISL